MATTVGSLFLFFLKAGAFVFGSGLAIVPFLYGGVVGKFHWLTERQFLDAIAVAMITPDLSLPHGRCKQTCAAGFRLQHQETPRAANGFEDGQQHSCYPKGHMYAVRRHSEDVVSAAG